MYGSSPIEVISRNAMVAKAVFCEAFDYVARFLVGTTTAVPASGSQQNSIQIDTAWDFVIQRIGGTWIQSDGTIDPEPNALIRFQRDSAGKYMSSAPIHWLNIMGSFDVDKVPDSLPFPVLLGNKTTYMIELTNLGTDAPDQVEIVFQGYKIYYNNTSRDQLFGRPY